jgi:hypothetical protein
MVGINNKKLIKTMKERFKKGYGQKCKKYCWGCAICEGYRAIEVLEDLLQDKT